MPRPHLGATSSVDTLVSPSCHCVHRRSRLAIALIEVLQGVAPVYTKDGAGAQVDLPPLVRFTCRVWSRVSGALASPPSPRAHGRRAPPPYTLNRATYIRDPHS